MQQWAGEMNAKSLSGPPMFLKPGCPKAGRDGILRTTSLCNSSSSSPGFLLCRWRGPGPGEATPVHVGKVEVGPRDRISFLTVGRGGVCVSFSSWVSLPTWGLREASETGPLLSGAKSSDQWVHATEVVQTIPHYTPLLLEELFLEQLKWCR